MPQRVRKRRHEPKTPASREAEHRRIHELIQEVTKDIRKFHRRHFDGKSVDYHGCSECLDKVLEGWQMDKDAISTWKEFIETTNAKSIDKNLQLSDEFDNLLQLCERSRDFEIMVPDMRNKLVSCVNDHVYKYCLSFEEDSKPTEITAIEEYEGFITGSKAEIDQKIDDANHSILRYGELKSPFYKFVFDGEEHGALMEDITTTFNEVCQILKKWTKDDTSYPEKLNQEIHFNQSYKEKLQDEISTLQNNKSSKEDQIDKLQKQRVKVENDYDTHKREKMKTKRRLETTETKVEHITEEKEKVTSQVEELKEQKSQKTARTPREKSDMDVSIARGQRDLGLLSEREGPMKRQKNRLKKELKQVSDRTYELKVEVYTIRHKRFELRKEIVGIDLEIKSIQERIDTIDHKTNIIKKVREKKLSPAYLRKRHLERRNEPPQEDKLQDACEYVAHSIGDDWKRLYGRLPFIPTRDLCRRQKDVEILDLIAAKRDRTDAEQARLSLEKWRWFNRRGDIPQLVKSLRKIHKVDIARKVENKYMVEDVYG